MNLKLILHLSLYESKKQVPFLIHLSAVDSIGFTGDAPPPVDSDPKEMLAPPEDQKNSNTHSLASTTSPVETEGDWKQAKTAAGKIYYYNKKTKQTSWKVPDSISTSNLSPPSETPGEWKEATSANGKKYYYNTLTKQSTWKKPNASTTSVSTIFTPPADASLPPLAPTPSSNQGIVFTNSFDKQIQM